MHLNDRTLVRPRPRNSRYEPTTEKENDANSRYEPMPRKEMMPKATTGTHSTTATESEYSCEAN